jgi:hypothetical protein
MIKRTAVIDEADALNLAQGLLETFAALGWSASLICVSLMPADRNSPHRRMVRPLSSPVAAVCPRGGGATIGPP